MATPPTTSPAASETSVPVPTRIPIPTAVQDASGALRAAVDALFGSNPPYATEDVATGRYLYTKTGIARQITENQYSAPVDSQPVWLFVFTGRFSTYNRFSGEMHVFYSAFVVVTSESGFFPGMMFPARSNYDLDPAGRARDVPSGQISALVAEMHCEMRHLGINPTECPTPLISLNG